MIFNYGFSLVGKSHITKETLCQDSNRILKMDNGWYIAAIADGVGSARNSRIGSKIAVDTTIDFCNKYMPWDYNIISIKSMLRTAYNYAFKQILNESNRSGEPIESYDTTLSIVIYDGMRIIFGHSGDGAIIGLTKYGDLVSITSPQKGPDGVSVLPLRAGYTQWTIDTYDEDLVSVLLMTDGMLETLCPYLLRENAKYRVYNPLGYYFADPTGISMNEDENNLLKSEIQEFLKAEDDFNSELFYKRLLEIYLKHIPEKANGVLDQLRKNNMSIKLMNNEQDDKTMVALINTKLELDDKNLEFYSEPNWEMLQDAWNKKAYPHIYPNTTATEVIKIISNIGSSEIAKIPTINVEDNNIEDNHKEIQNLDDLVSINSNISETENDDIKKIFEISKSMSNPENKIKNERESISNNKVTHKKSLFKKFSSFLKDS